MQNQAGKQLVKMCLLLLTWFSQGAFTSAARATIPLSGTDTSYFFSPQDMMTLGLPGLARYYIVHTPPNYNPQQAYPLVLFLHGGSGGAHDVSTKQVNLSLYADQLANANQPTFLVVYPQGYTSSAGGYWNSGNCDDGTGKGINGTNITACTPDAYLAGSEDVTYINTILNLVSSQYIIDGKRIYAMGHSNGAVMSNRLGCELSSRITAVAPIEGTIKISPCNPGTVPVSIIEFASLTDPNSTYCGDFADTSVSYTLGLLPSTTTTCAKNPAQINFGPGVWQGVNSCFGGVSETKYTNPAPLSGVSPNYQLSTFSGCRTGTAVSLYTLQDAPHGWLYSTSTLVVDWRSKAWSFFQSKAKP